MIIKNIEVNQFNNQIKDLNNIKGQVLIIY